MELLPEPAWSPAEAQCLGCGYSLAGLTPPTFCPECGLPYSGRQFVCFGIADARSTMSIPRLITMGAIVGVGMFAPQILLIIGLSLPWWVTLSVLAVALAGVVYFIVSAPRSYGGTARLVFDQAGATVLPMAVKRQRKPGERWAVCTFDGSERVELRQVSDTWAKLRVRRPDGRTLFSGGIQLPMVRHDEVKEALRRVVARLPPTDEIVHHPGPPPLPGER